MSTIEIDQLVWDKENIEHIARHDILTHEVEEACIDQEIIVRTSYGGRYLVTGKTAEGKLISIVLDPEEIKDCYYVVTARSANKKERREYDKNQTYSSV